MVNLKDITIAVEALLKENLSDYHIERNPERPDDPWKATAKKAWVGVYRGSLEYEGHSIGSRPWLAKITIVLEVQTASLTSAENCEDKLLSAENEVLGVINAHRNLSGTVDMVTGYSVTYEENRDTQAYFQAAIITVRAEVRTT